MTTPSPCSRWPSTLRDGTNRASDAPPKPSARHTAIWRGGWCVP